MITAPTQISGLQVWLDASDTTTLFQLSGGTTAVGDDNPVGYWRDKSGNNRHFLNNAGTTASRPTYVSSLSTLRFDGVNDYLSSSFSLTYTAQTVFLVVSQRATGTNTRIYTQVSSGGVDNSATGHYIPCLATGAATLASWNAGGGKSTVTTRGLSSFDIFTSWVSATSGVNFINGSSGSYYGATLNYAVALSRIGAAATTAASYFNGDISEVIVYNRALTNVERADVEYYLTRKWNFLNSIPRQVYGIKNGLWSLTDTWSVSAEPSPWNYPLSADNAYTNTFTITADSSTNGGTLRNSTVAPNISSGGSFWLADGVSLSANVFGGAAPYIVTLLPTASATLVGTIQSGSTVEFNSVSATQNSSLTIVGDVYGGQILTLGQSSLIFENDTQNYIFGNIYGGKGRGFGVFVRGNSTLNVVGNVFGGTTQSSTGAHGINFAGSSKGNIIGNVYGRFDRGVAVSIGSTNVVNITGSVISETLAKSIEQSSASSNLTITGDVTDILVSSGTLNVLGNVYARANDGQYGINSSLSNNVVSITGNIINAPNGRQAIYAPRYQVFPTGSAQYTRQASNGYDSYVDYWTSNSTFSYPASSDVALGTTYSNSTLSGSMAVPSPSSVALGALVGTTTGTASITLDNVLSQPIANLTTPNSIGARLKNITTSQALSAIVDSLEF
jgi:hypothetical protein